MSEFAVHGTLDVTVKEFPSGSSGLYVILSAETESSMSEMVSPLSSCSGVTGFSQDHSMEITAAAAARCLNLIIRFSCHS